MMKIEGQQMRACVLRVDGVAGCRERTYMRPYGKRYNVWCPRLPDETWSVGLSNKLARKL